MRVLFVTVGEFPRIEHRGIYSDLLREFRDRGHDVYVACPRERRDGGQIELLNDSGVRILKVPTGNLTKTGFFEKALATLLVERQFKAAIDRLLSDVRFDLVMYSTPPVTLDRLVSHLKKRDGCTSCLLLKDIFPQNAVDLGIISTGGLPWRYFRYRERRLYAVSDWIGCMSTANVAHVLEHNPEIPANRVEVCANSISPLPRDYFRRSSRADREEFGLPQDAVVFVYGGNLGRPQGVDYILECLNRAKGQDDVFFLIVASGTEYSRVARYLAESQQGNARLCESLPKDSYDRLLSVCDVGLIFLDHRFTIPNFPSRLTAYMEAGLPVIAATDRVTDIRVVLEEAGCGVWLPSDDADAFVRAVRHLASEPDLRRQMGDLGRAYLEEHYTVARAYETIVSHVTLPMESDL